MTENRIHSRHAATQDTVIDGIVVHECGEVNEFHDRRVIDRERAARLFDRIGEQHQRGAQELAFHALQVAIHFANEWVIVCDDVPHARRYEFELRTHRILYAGERVVEPGPRGNR